MGLRHIRFGLLLGFMMAALPLQAFAAVPLQEVLASPAGRLIFGELIEGSLVANRVLGTNVANPATRMQRMIEALADQRLSRASTELDTRVNRIYEQFARENPDRADELFRNDNPALNVTAQLADAERRLIRSLVTRELNRPFLDEMTALCYRDARDNFLRGGDVMPVEPIAPTMSATERALVFWETRKNAASSRSANRVEIEHYEIPLDLVHADVSNRIAPELHDALIFEKNGRPHVRWIINPEDTEHYKAVESFLTRNGIAPTRFKRFQGYQTSSRSYILVDPVTDRHVVFSSKVSTNNTGGMWRDKKQPFDDAIEARRAADFVRMQENRRGFVNIVTMDEPLMFGIREIDQAMLVRVLGDLPGGEVTYLPGFSAVHDDLGIRIARANGSNDPAAFWNEHYNKPLARALAELAARTGLTYDSPHSQNFLIEMVGVNPTGRIVLRDFGDTYALRDFFEAMGHLEFFRTWAPGNIITGRLAASIGVVHGNQFPSWMNERIYREWGVNFYRAFESEFAAQTGVPQAEMAATAMSQSGRYFTKLYPSTSATWRRYFASLTAGLRGI